MGSLFISYSRQDLKVVDFLVSRLKDDGFDVWIDRENIRAGDLWREKIVRAIKTADAFVLMLSPNSVKSDNVRKEMDLAESTQRGFFPVLLAPVNVPDKLMYQLSGIQWIEFHLDPETQYRDLVEILRAHQRTLGALPETRRAEVVIGATTEKQFGEKEQDALIQLLARKAKTPPAGLRLVKVTAGSVHAFVEMPADAAYSLTTAALNRDRDLIKHGIDAMRLDGEENYVLLKTGSIGPLDLKPPRPLLPRLLLMLLGAGVLFTALFATVLALAPILNPPPTATPTQTPIPATATPTPTLTPSSTATATETFTPSPTPNPPPPAPEVVSPYHGLTVTCSQVKAISLEWRKPFDENGIDRYRVVLDVHIDGAWQNVIDREVAAEETRLDITRDFLSHCGDWLRWKVQAMDGAGVWGAWSAEHVFLGEEPPILLFVPVLNFPPPAPEIISPAHKSIVYCFSGNVYVSWAAPDDPDGIAGYEVELYQHDNAQWNLSLSDTVDGSMKEYEITKFVNEFCGRWLSWRVRARDGLGALGSWSSQPVFQAQEPPK
jgi:hypothetical protein